MIERRFSTRRGEAAKVTRNGSNLRRNLLFGLTVLTFALTSAGTARASVVTPTIDNVEGLTEAALTTDSMLFQAFGFSLTGQLTLNGTFNTSGYLFTLTGTVSGMAVNLSFTGGLDSGTGRQTFTGTGSAGGFSVSESGEYDFDNSNPLDIFYTGGEVATLAGKGGFDIEIEGKQEVTVTDAGDHYIIRDVSTYIDTPSGNKHIEISNITPSKPQGQGAYNVTTDQINLIGNVDFNAGTISGQLSPIPEPGTVLLLGPALAALFFRRRAKRCNQSTSR